MIIRGRPRKACAICKAQKIRCSGERPSCKRCIRLKHTCSYDSHAPYPKKSSSSRQAGSAHLPSLSAAETHGHETSGIDNAAGQAGKYRVPTLAVSLNHLGDGSELGIPRSVALTLVETYFDNMYNAGFFLPRKRFLESVAAGTARTHVVLSVCAWGANFFRDAAGQATFIQDGSMIEWARRAGRLVFEEVENLDEDNLVTFSNLALFWHSQGSWRTSQLHKGNAYQVLYINGSWSRDAKNYTSLESEIRRRRFWACYLMHCYSPENLDLFQPVPNIEDLSLPWPEEDFNAGIPRGPSVSLSSGQSNGGIFCELVIGLTFWSSVVSAAKAETSFQTRLTRIHDLDDKLSNWWQRVRPGFKLDDSNISLVSPDMLPLILIVNVVYHQCLCALHASIVPLFSWGHGDGGGWANARQLSAQLAFDHACRVSEIINGVLTTDLKLSAVPNFVAYAAYCGCAIQIPFMWCANTTVRERVNANVKANVRMIQAIATYWRLAAMLQVHVRCLYRIHSKVPTSLEDEPKYLDLSKLTDFKGRAAYARVSILEFTGILRAKGDGYPREGDEADDLGMEENGEGEEVHASEEQWEPLQLSQQHQPDQVSMPTDQQQEEAFPTAPGPIIDVSNTLLDPEMLTIFPDAGELDLTQFDLSWTGLDYLDANMDDLGAVP